jgi:hypothetical protein
VRIRTIALAIGTIIATALAPVTPARAADPVTVTFSFTGVEQSWTVPAGVTSIHAVLVGARGAGFGPGSQGGFGHRAEADVTVAPGQTIYVEVGGPGSAGGLTAGGIGGFNGGASGGHGGILGSGSGGGGGGGTDLRTVSQNAPGTLGSRLVVAGGGGGNGGGVAGGAGGNAGDSGGNSIGGGTTGGAPGFDGVFGCGGCGGNSGGEAGVMGVGGRGGDDPTIGGGDSGAGGGGGGGGYQGGGGGGGGSTNGGGGGGGSSFADGWSLANPNVTVDATGTSLASITYDPDGGGPGGGGDTSTVDAVVTMASTAVCLELSTSSIDFGTRRFGEVDQAASPSIDVTNCGGINEAVLARATDATGPGSSAWSLVDSGSCAAGTLGTDAFRLTLVYPAAPGAAIPLSTANTPAIVSLAPGSTIEQEALLDTPCPGSSGAGEVMSMQILYVAIEEALP